jgi:hypothetical protein
MDIFRITATEKHRNNSSWWHYLEPILLYLFTKLIENSSHFNHRENKNSLNYNIRLIDFSLIYPCKNKIDNKRLRFEGIDIILETPRELLSKSEQRTKHVLL